MKVFFLLIFFTSILNSQSLESGLNSWERGHYSTAIRAWIEIAKAGNASAENNIGYAYEKGLGARQDYFEALKRYKNAEFIWCQEEPMNMGAWNTVKYYIDRTLEMVKIKGEILKYVGRNAAASPATGNLNKHLAEQKEILEKVVGRLN